jgi:drug/metabolite transporter (DMT)-like permease
MMQDRLTVSQIILLVIYAGGMSAGQILFKMAALRSGAADSGNHLIGLIWNPYFLAAAILYAGYALLWVWILTFVPLSRAYPFVALAFAITPLFGGLLFGEAITMRLVSGLLLILGGLLLVTGG